MRSRIADGPNVVAVPGIPVSSDAASVLDLLVDLAAREELVIVYGYLSGVCLSPHDLIAALRERLPARGFTAVIVDAQPRPQDPELELICYLLNDGAIAIAVAPGREPGAAAAALAAHLDAATCLELIYDEYLGARLQSLGTPAAHEGAH